MEIIMTTLSKTLLAAGVTGLVAGSITDFAGFNFNPVWMAGLPLGAVFCGMFLISFMLEKEMALFDAERAKKLAVIKTGPPAPQFKPPGGPVILPLTPARAAA
jgi:hypothetical protein